MTKVLRLPIWDDSSTLESRLIDLCDTMLAAKMKLQAMTVTGDQLLLVFQLAE